MPAFPSVGGWVERGADLVRSAWQSNPVAVAGAAALVLLVVALGAYGLHRYRRPPVARLSSVLGAADTVTILLHPNPDPDAMATGVGLAHLAERAGSDSVLQYTGEIRHPENRAFRTVLELDLERIEDREDLASETVVLADHNEPRGFIGADAVRPTAVVDHHPGGGTGRLFTDVRPEYGAASTIVAEYLDDLGLTPTTEPDEVDNPLPAETASALMYGILADTDHLTAGATPAEFSASAYLSDGIDEDALDRIANPTVDAESLDVKAKAIERRQVQGPFAVSHVGSVSNADAIPQAADELLQLEGVSAVVVSGEKDGTIHLSGRSRDDRVHMGRTMEYAVEDVPMGNGGGHARMGGAQLSVDHMEGLGPSDGLSIDDLHDRLLAAMNGET
ncbi:MAG: bifunctional oligoribonuclease/PAP phosphatase NrnA [Halanaeroarchaeum sp.]